MNGPVLSLRRHLVGALTLAIAGLFGAGSVVTYFVVRRAMVEQMDRHLNSMVEDFVEEIERAPNGAIESEFHEMDLDHFAKSNRDSAAYYQLFDADGRTILRSRSLEDSESLPFIALDGGGPVIESATLPSGAKGRIAYVSLRPRLETVRTGDSENTAAIADLTPEQAAYVATYDPNAPENRVFLVLAEETGSVRRALLSLEITLGLTGVFLAGASFLLVRKIVASGCRPIVGLSKQTEEMSVNALDMELPTEGIPCEVLPLVEKFNQFIRRVKVAMQRERRFTIDIAHELRTPVTELRALLEVGVGPGEDPGEIFSAGAAIARRMTRIIEALTGIYHSEMQARPLKKEEVPIRQVIEESVQAFSPEQKGRIRWGENGASFGSVESDPDLIRCVVDNLLGNALDHSPADSEVMVMAKERGFVVKNETETLTEGDLGQFAEPFWQKDQSRADAEHFGLGLTLVQAYLQLLGGTMTSELDSSTLTMGVAFNAKS